MRREYKGVADRVGIRDVLTRYEDHRARVICKDRQQDMLSRQSSSALARIRRLKIEDLNIILVPLGVKADTCRVHYILR